MKLICFIVLIQVFVSRTSGENNLLQNKLDQCQLGEDVPVFDNEEFRNAVEEECLSECPSRSKRNANQGRKKGHNKIKEETDDELAIDEELGLEGDNDSNSVSKNVDSKEEKDCLKQLSYGFDKLQRKMRGRGRRGRKPKSTIHAITEGAKKLKHKIRRVCNVRRIETGCGYRRVLGFPRHDLLKVYKELGERAKSCERPEAVECVKSLIAENNNQCLNFQNFLERSKSCRKNRCTCLEEHQNAIESDDEDRLARCLEAVEERSVEMHEIFFTQVRKGCPDCQKKDLTAVNGQFEKLVNTITTHLFPKGSPRGCGNRGRKPNLSIFFGGSERVSSAKRSRSNDSVVSRKKSKTQRKDSSGNKKTRTGGKKKGNKGKKKTNKGRRKGRGGKRKGKRTNSKSKGKSGTNNGNHNSQGQDRKNGKEKSDNGNHGNANGNNGRSDDEDKEKKDNNGNAYGRNDDNEEKEKKDNNGNAYGKDKTNNGDTESEMASRSNEDNNEKTTNGKTKENENQSWNSDKPKGKE